LSSYKYLVYTRVTDYTPAWKDIEAQAEEEDIYSAPEPKTASDDVSKEDAFTEVQITLTDDAEEELYDPKRKDEFLPTDVEDMLNG